MPSIVKNAGDEASDFIETIKEIEKTNKEPSFIAFATLIGIRFQEEERI
jgi:transketolase